ncbi:ATP-binding protein, partial [Corynebacterium flavescens]|uniref:ATP-binding protein n=1 Tax=Corynebacterium flavescens TaxID=28028 RepID=UPI003FD4C9E3
NAGSTNRHLLQQTQTLATATVDRLFHHAHLIQTTGDSVRMTQALEKNRSTETN